MSTGSGRRSITGIGAGRPTGPGLRCSTSCAAGPMAIPARSGRWASTRRCRGLISTPRGRDSSRRPMLAWRSPTPPGCAQGAGSNDKKSGLNADPDAGREALGRSRGGLSTKIHLAADDRARPISRIITPGQRHDAVCFEPVMAGIRIARRGRGASAPDPARYGATRPTPAGRSAPTCADAASRPPSPSRPTSRPTGPAGAATADDHPGSTPRTTPSATPSSAASTNSRDTAPWPPATTNAPTPSPAPSMSPQSDSGCVTPSHDPRNTPQRG